MVQKVSLHAPIDVHAVEERDDKAQTEERHQPAGNDRVGAFFERSFLLEVRGERVRHDVSPELGWSVFVAKVCVGPFNKTNDDFSPIIEEIC